MLTSQFRPGRNYSFVYVSDVEMVGKRDGKVNPLADCAVSVRRVTRCQAAGPDTYENVMRKENPEFEKSGKPAWYHTTDENPCIVEHNKEATRYVRGIPRGIVKEEYFIGANPASESEVETIRAFKKNKRDGEPAFILYKLDNIENLVDDAADLAD